MTPEDVKKLREAATPGPWLEWCGEIGTEDECVVMADDIDGEANAAFIAAAHDMADPIQRDWVYDCTEEKDQ